MASRTPSSDGCGTTVMRRDGRGKTVMRKADEICKRVPDWQAAVVFIENGERLWLYESQPNLLASLGFAPNNMVIEERCGPDHFQSVAERNQAIAYQRPAIEAVRESSLFVSPPPTTPPDSPRPKRQPRSLRRGRRTVNPSTSMPRNTADEAGENAAKNKEDIFGFTNMDGVE